MYFQKPIWSALECEEWRNPYMDLIGQGLAVLMFFCPITVKQSNSTRFLLTLFCPKKLLHNCKYNFESQNCESVNENREIILRGLKSSLDTASNHTHMFTDSYSKEKMLV